MTFEEYLIKKRIDKAAFEAEDAARYGAWENMYSQMHQNSFYMAVKMVINDVRLKYHLREEDIQKAAPAIVAPKPVMRRAPVAASPSETTPAVAAEQQTNEEKPASTAATFKPRPVVKRPASLQKPPVEEEATHTAPITEGEAATPGATGDIEKPTAKPRPVIKRPIIPRSVSNINVKPEENEAQQTASPEATDGNPVRPRPVIKRPAALQKPADNEIIQELVSVPSPVVEPIPTEQAPDAPKPARPRPIIKRPAALSTLPVDQDQPATAAENKTDPEAAEVSSKPPRPRPIIKRPMPAATQEPIASAQTEKEPKDEGNIQQVPEEKPKPPRPRPIMRRPTKSDDADSETNV